VRRKCCQLSNYVAINIEGEYRIEILKDYQEEEDGGKVKGSNSRKVKSKCLVGKESKEDEEEKAVCMWTYYFE
jgi:hypothetical protein